MDETSIELPSVGPEVQAAVLHGEQLQQHDEVPLWR